MILGYEHADGYVVITSQGATGMHVGQAAVVADCGQAWHLLGDTDAGKKLFETIVKIFLTHTEIKLVWILEVGAPHD